MAYQCHFFTISKGMNTVSKLSLHATEFVRSLASVIKATAGQIARMIVKLKNA